MTNQLRPEYRAILAENKLNRVRAHLENARKMLKICETEKGRALWADTVLFFETLETEYHSDLHMAIEEIKESARAD